MVLPEDHLTIGAVLDTPGVNSASSGSTQPISLTIGMTTLLLLEQPCWCQAGMRLGHRADLAVLIIRQLGRALGKCERRLAAVPSAGVSPTVGPLSGCAGVRVSSVFVIRYGTVQWMPCELHERRACPYREHHQDK
jgi:hypothetical protein